MSNVKSDDDGSKSLAVKTISENGMMTNFHNFSSLTTKQGGQTKTVIDSSDFVINHCLQKSVIAYKKVY